MADYSNISFKNNGKLRLLIIVGTRPEIIRLAAVINKTRKYFDVILAHTGQNYDYNLNGVFFRDLELADPVVSPAYTAGLEGTPNELKLKYLADNDFAGLDGEELRQAIKGRIAAKDGSSLVGNMVSEGTTPRRLTDLIGSLCDLTSGSGDKGTPIVYIQGYFDNYTND